MTLLLDTHALLWALAEPARLSRRALLALQNPANELRVSAVSLFEIATKVRLGKLPDTGALLRQVDLTLARLNATLTVLSGAQAILAGNLNVSHRDPFDRLLAAQALDLDVPLVTCDPAFGLFPKLTVLW